MYRPYRFGHNTCAGVAAHGTERVPEVATEEESVMPDDEPSLKAPQGPGLRNERDDILRALEPSRRPDEPPDILASGFGQQSWLPVTSTRADSSTHRSQDR